MVMMNDKNTLNPYDWPDAEAEVINSMEAKESAEEKAGKRPKRAKNYWFLKIPKDFFARPECQQLIDSAPTKVEGIIRCALYERMLLRSCDTPGLLYLSSRCPYTPLTLSTTLGLNAKDESQVQMLKDTIGVLIECGVIYLDARATIHITTFDELTESSSQSAIRRRQERLEKLTDAQQKQIDETIKIAKMKWLEG